MERAKHKRDKPGSDLVEDLLELDSGSDLDDESEQEG